MISKQNVLWVALLSIFLTACGGGDPVVQAASPQDGEDIIDEAPDSGDGVKAPDPDPDPDEGAVVEAGPTYFPLQFLMTGDEYVGDQSGYFEGVWFYPLIHGYVIAPVDGATLEPIDSPKISDYSVTINGEAIEPGEVETGLMMQKVIGLPVKLNTAIVIDTSGSTQSMDKVALVTEIKRFVSLAQSSTDPIIAGQSFTLWAFADSSSAFFSYGVEPLVGSLTTDAATLNAALDSLPADWESRGNGTALYEAIVYAVGNYKGSGESGLSSEIDLKTDDIADLIDGYIYDEGSTSLLGVNLSNVILLSAGNNSVFHFSSTDALNALQWQSMLTYVEQAATEDTPVDTEVDSAASETVPIGKPLFYVSLGTDAVDEKISAMAATTIETASTNTFSFAEQLIAAQKNAVSIRIRPTNQYLVRYAVLERDGEHELKFTSNSTGYNYALTTDLNLASTGPWLDPQPFPMVEITGPENSYLAGGRVSVKEVTELYPATRWSPVSFEVSDYSWTVGGISRVANANGSLTISSSDIGLDVVLTNGSLSSGVTTSKLTVID